jgi:hypothetical protein
MQNAARSVRGPPVSGFAVTGARKWTSAPATTSTAISAPMAGSRSRSLTSLISVGALPSASTRSGSRRKSGAGAAPMAWRPLFRCCNLVPGTQSQLLPDCKCAYTRNHQDSATMEVLTHFHQDEIALSLTNDSAIIRARCRSEHVAMLSRVGDGVEGVPNDFI